MMKKNVKLKELFDQVYDNALSDRERAIELFEDLCSQMQSQLSNHATAGAVIAKYLERLNKANDQLLKLSELIQHTDEIENKHKTRSMTEADRDALFEMIKNKQENDDE